MTRHRTGSALVVALALAAVPHVAGCKSSERVARTEVLVKLDAGPSVRAEVTRLRIELSRGPSADKLEPIDPEIIDIDGKFTWPASLALVPRGDSGELAFAIRVVAEAGSETIAEARAESSFRKGKTLLLELFLPDECLRFFLCGAHETCVASGGGPLCVPAERDPDKLPEFDPTGGASGSSGSGGADDDAGRTDGGDLRDGGSPDGGADGGAGGTGGSGCEGRVEDCFDGDDNDCDGDVDCADSDCDAIVACVPEGARIGVLVSAGATCPDGYDDEPIVLHRGLRGGDCDGCGCAPSGDDCTATAYFYADTTTCGADAAHTGGTLVGTVTWACSTNPIGQEEGMYTPAGWRVGEITATYSNCTASGTADPGAPSWGETKKLCVSRKVAGGCAQGMACVAAPGNRTVCSETTVAGACPKATEASSGWYESYDDTRVCGSCDCSATGSGCDGVEAFLGSDYSCGPNTSQLGADGQDCAANAYSPPAQLIGSPKCEATAPLSGELTPKLRHDLCCLP